MRRLQLLEMTLKSYLMNGIWNQSKRWRNIKSIQKIKVLIWKRKVRLWIAFYLIIKINWNKGRNTEWYREKNLDLVKIQEISNTISRDTVNTYGTNVQSKLGAVSSQLLETVKGKDSGEVNKDLNALINVLKQNDPKKMFSVNDGFFSRLFGRVRDNIELRIREHESVQKQIDAIKRRLEDGVTVIRRG